MTTTLNTTTVLKAFLGKEHRSWQMVGHCIKTDGTPVQVWYDPVADVLYADATFGVAATQNPTTTANSPTN